MLLVGHLAGCASIVSGRKADVTINSYPPQAQVTVCDEKGQPVASGTTPTTVSLARGKGLFKKGQRYAATIQHPGYQPAVVPIEPKVNPWIAGNVIGGLPGVVVGLGTDSVTGAMWKYTPEIDQNLTPLPTALSDASAPDELLPVQYVTDAPPPIEAAAQQAPTP